MSAPVVATSTSRPRALVPVLMLAFALVGCRTAEDRATPPADTATVHALIRAADSAFATAAAAHDLEGSVGSLTADAIMLAPDQPPIVGRAAIREYMRESFATPGFSVSWTTDTIVASASGDMAYSFARSRYTFPARSGKPGAIDTAYGKGLSVWRREADGRWRTVADIWNGAPTLPPIRPRASAQ